MIGECLIGALVACALYFAYYRGTLYGARLAADSTRQKRVMLEAYGMGYAHGARDAAALCAVATNKSSAGGGL